MSAEQQTKEALVAYAPLLALLPDGASGIAPDEIDETATLPALSYERSNTENTYTLDNTLIASKVTITVTVWVDEQSGGRRAANAVATEAAAAMNASGYGSVEDSRSSSFEPESREFATVQSFEVWEFPTTPEEQS